MPDSPRMVSIWVVSLVLENTANPILIYKERVEDADAIVRRAIQVRAWWGATGILGREPDYRPLPRWPQGAHGDLDVPGWMLPYVAEIVNNSGPSLKIRGFIDLRFVITCAVMRTEIDPSQISNAPFSE